MRNKLIIAVLAVAVGLPVASLTTSSPGAAEEGRYRAARKYKRTYVKKRKWRDDSYAARAHNLDPAGDYKGYPDWARVALSPKSDGRTRR